jgi:FkbM family methyltransferase
MEKIVFKKLFRTLLPYNIQRKIISIREKYFYDYAIKSYSQEGEDMILKRLFEKKETGFYVDVGAHHPKRFSNTYYFYKKGWYGINIDAMPGSMDLFKKHRPRDINIEAAISDKKEVLIYYIFNEPALNGFCKEISESRNGSNSYFIDKKISIVTVTLDEILNKYMLINKEIDFLTIDVEGLDFNVIKSLNLNKYQPKVILIEILQSDLHDIHNNQITSYLYTYGYKIFSKSFNTVFFKK